MSGCIGCNQSIIEQKSNDEKTIQLAKDKAKAESKTIGLYRDADGTLCIAPGSGYPIIIFITPKLQNP